MTGSSEQRLVPVSDLGEDALVARIAERIGPAPRGQTWSGDDAAVFEVPQGSVVATTDLMVEGVDFDRAYCTGTDVGWKLVACNVSDVAAMGAAPAQATVTLMLPPSTTVGFVDDFLEGVVTAARRWGVDVVGGDLSSGPSIAASLALLGRPFAEPILRSGARPGDAICVTGSLGGAGGGLVALRAGAVDRDAVDAEIGGRTGAEGLAVLALRQLRPMARVEQAHALVSSGLTAAIDVSDGFALDLHRLLRASGGGCDVDAEAVPVEPELGFLADHVDDAPQPLDLALTGGEDYELLVTLDPRRLDTAQAAVDETGVGLSLVGRVTDGAALLGGEPLERWSETAWDHLLTP